MATPTEQIEEFRNRLREVDLLTLLAFDRELHRLLDLKRETQRQTAPDTTAQRSFASNIPTSRLIPTCLLSLASIPLRR